MYLYIVYIYICIYIYNFVFNLHIIHLYNQINSTPQTHQHTITISIYRPVVYEKLRKLRSRPRNGELALFTLYLYFQTSTWRSNSSKTVHIYLHNNSYAFARNVTVLLQKINQVTKIQPFTLGISRKFQLYNIGICDIYIYRFSQVWSVFLTLNFFSKIVREVD